MLADQLSPLIGEDDIIWVHDYHLMLLGRELRSSGHQNRIGFFLHMPFAPPDIIQTLPLHDVIFGSLANYDLVGFQTDNDRDNFASYLIARGAQPRSGALEIDGQRVKLGVFPVSIETTIYVRIARNAGALAADRARQGEPRRMTPRARRRPAGLFQRHSRADEGASSGSWRIIREWHAQGDASCRSRRRAAPRSRNTRTSRPR